MLKPSDVKVHSLEDGYKIEKYEQQIDKALKEELGRAVIRVPEADKEAIRLLALRYEEAGWHIGYEDRSMTAKSKDDFLWLKVTHPSHLRRS